MSESGLYTNLAKVYDDFYGPAVLHEWADLVAKAARIEAGERILDVACGTGILTRTVFDRVGRRGAVIGIDPNAAMLAVARRKAREIMWYQGRAEALPFEDNHFDVAASQFGLMFFTDRPLAVQEMIRVLRPGGRLAVAVWDAVENFPIYAELARLLQQHYADAVVEEFLVPHSLGSPELLAALFTSAGVDRPVITRQEATARFPSLREWLWIEVKEWLLGDRLDDADFEVLLAEAQERFRSFLTAEGALVSPAPGLIAIATKPQDRDVHASSGG